jgi:nicotinate phosphoribosyltransferase
MNPNSVLLTDLYQLTMLQGYFQQGMEEVAVFEFFVREMPDERNFFMAGGLHQVLDFLEHLAITENELDWLYRQKRFNDDFLDYLNTLRFAGDVHAMPEGTIFFPDEPIIRVTAPIPQAQLVESRIINILQFQTMIASKAARMQLAAPGKLMVDFGLRRAHGAEAGLFAARASYLAGFAGSSTVQAGPVYDIPIFGTMAHSFIQAHDSEEEAFRHFALSQPENVVLLIDTYDTEAGAHKVVRLASALRERGIEIRAVRLDSGDLVEHARKVRKILDDGGLPEVKIFTSGNLDEYILAHFTETAAPIDGMGIGTKMVTSADKPYLDCAYKLCEYAGLPRRKKSEGKSTWPGRKQVFRSTDTNSLFSHDILSLEGDSQQGIPLVKQVMSQGILLPQPKLTESRDYAGQQLACLPPALRSLKKAPAYPVKVSDALQECVAEVDSRI